MGVNRLDQRRNMLWRRKLANAMAQVKDVSRASAVGIGVRFPKTVKHPMHFFLNLGGGCKQDIGVDVALQRFARPIHRAAHHLARTAQVHGPVKAQHFAVELAHLFKPQTAALGEHNAWNFDALVLFLQKRQDLCRVGQAEFLEG